MKCAPTSSTPRPRCCAAVSSSRPSIVRPLPIAAQIAEPRHRSFDRADSGDDSKMRRTRSCARPCRVPGNTAGRWFRRCGAAPSAKRRPSAPIRRPSANCNAMRQLGDEPHRSERRSRSANNAAMRSSMPWGGDVSRRVCGAADWRAEALCYHRAGLRERRMKLKIPSFRDAHVLVIGDVMLDRYWYGTSARVSQEAPVPVVDIESDEDRPGGAANVALNLAAFGVDVTLIGVVGDDDAARILRQKLVGGQHPHRTVAVGSGRRSSKCASSAGASRCCGWTSKNRSSPTLKRR